MHRSNKVKHDPSAALTAKFERLIDLTRLELTNITVLCDFRCLTIPSAFPDVGIMASTYIAAVKIANLIPGGIPKGPEFGTNGYLFGTVHGKDTHMQPDQPEKLNLGTQKYNPAENC